MSSKKLSGFLEANEPRTPASATVKCGWVEKFSVGRGFFPVRNWKKRWLMVTHQGLNYTKDKGTPAAGRTYVPFVSNNNHLSSSSNSITTTNNNPTTNLVALMSAEKERMSKGGVVMNPVFLFPTVTATIHSEATDPDYFYFGLRFEEVTTARILLLRVTAQPEREAWVRFIGQFVHAASINGVPNKHPALVVRGTKNCPIVPTVRDPEELDPRSQNEVRRSVMCWDDGFQYRAFGAEAPCENMHDDPLNWDSDGGETNGVSSPRESQVSGAQGSGVQSVGGMATSNGERRNSGDAAATAGGGQKTHHPSPHPSQTQTASLGGGDLGGASLTPQKAQQQQKPAAAPSLVLPLQEKQNVGCNPNSDFGTDYDDCL